MSSRDAAAARGAARRVGPRAADRDAAEPESIEERIAQSLRDSEAEMRASPAFGKPLPDDGYFDAPPELRLAFKVLKNAGGLPHEVELMQELQGLRDRLAALPGGDQAQQLRARIAELELIISLRVERLAKTLTL